MRASLIGGDIPVISPLWEWLRHGGNWRLAAVAALVMYQIVLFTILCIHLAQAHAF